MITNVKEYKQKLIRIEPSPFRGTNIKIMKSMAKVNSAGYAITDSDGNLRTTEEPVDKAVQVPGTSKTVGPVLTAGGLRTGLGILVDNPYNDEPAYYPAWGEKVLQGKEKALLQHVLEYKHKKDFDHYTGNLMDRISASSDVPTLPFFLTPQSKVILDGGVKTLNLDNQLHEVWYYMLKAHPIVANSYADLDNGRNPDAWYYIVDEAEVQDHKLAELRKETKAGRILEELNEKGDLIIKFARALENTDKNLNTQKAYKWLYSYYHDNSGKKIDKDRLAIFMKYYELYSDANRRERFFAAANVQEYLNYGVLRQRDGRFYWVKPETAEAPMRTFEWTSKEKIISDFFLAPEYQDEVELLESIYKSRSNVVAGAE